MSNFKARSDKDRISYICDSYVTIDEQEILLCRCKDETLAWVSRLDVPTDVFDAFSSNKTIDGHEENVHCNNDKIKVFTCLLKCKTIGILIAASPCGIILGIRELYGSESPNQTAFFYLEL